jgi:hypothetical protein
MESLQREKGMDTVNAKKCGIHHCVEIVDNPKEINRIKREIEAIEHNNTIDKKGDDKS